MASLWVVENCDQQFLRWGGTRMSRNIRIRRLAVGAAFAIALIGLTNAPAAEADAPAPFEELFGDTGINTWTPAADASLLSSDPALAGSLDTSVENFLAGVIYLPDYPNGDAPFSYLVSLVDPAAFSGDFGFGIDGGVPQDAIGDFAVGLDYTLFASGIPGVDVGVSDLLNSVESISAEISGWAVLLDLIFAGLFLGG
jgi:hypothetical protein